MPAQLHGGGDHGGRSFRPVFQPWQALVEHGESVLAVQDQESPAAHLGDEQSTVVQGRQPAGRRQPLQCAMAAGCGGPSEAQPAAIAATAAGNAASRATPAKTAARVGDRGRCSFIRPMQRTDPALQAQGGIGLASTVTLL